MSQGEHIGGHNADHSGGGDDRQCLQELGEEDYQLNVIDHGDPKHGETWAGTKRGGNWQWRGWTDQSTDAVK